MTKNDMLEQAKNMRNQVAVYDLPLPAQRHHGITRSEQTIDVPNQDALKLIIYTPNYLPSQGIILNFRGSGFMYPWTDSDYAFAKSLVYATNYTVIDVDYPIAPEHPFPAAVDAAFAAFKYVQESFTTFAPVDSPLIVMGHSAGGNLAVTTQLRAKKDGIPLANKVVLDFPVLDLATDAADKKYPDGKGIPVAESRLMNRFYLQNDTVDFAKNPMISPIFASTSDLLGFPTTIIHTAEFDSLRDEAETFAQHLVAAYVRVTLARYPNAYHGFTVVKTPIGQQSFEELVHDILK